MSTDTRTGFRLPWSSDRPSHDELPPAADGPDATGEPAGDLASGEAASSPGGWPDADFRTRAFGGVPAAAAPTDPVTAAPASPPIAQARPEHKRPTKFLADLTAAMRTAAEGAREQTLSQFESDTKQVIAGIHEASATEATELRTRADGDIAGIREWSKAEIARIREETEARITQRKASLETELEDHAASVEWRVGEVQAAVAAFEQEMAGFFERLFAETDPARFAAMAESMPEPPSLDAHAASPAAVADPWTPVAPPDGAQDAAGDGPAGEDDGAAAELAAPDTAEVETFAGGAEGQLGAPEDAPTGVIDPAPEGPSVELDANGQPVDRSAIMAALEAAAEAVVAAEAAAESASQAEEAADLAETAAELLASRIEEGEGWGDLDSAEAEAAFNARIEAGGIETDSFVDRLAGLAARPDAADGGPVTSQVIVTGLVSVASIASFKRHLGRLAGVDGVSVSSGPDGEFVFSATHRPDVSFRDVIPTLPGFGARVTSASDGVVHVTAHDPEADA